MKQIEKLNWHDKTGYCKTDKKHVKKEIREVIDWYKKCKKEGIMPKSMLEEKKKDIQRARKSLTTFYNDLKNVNHWEHKIYKSIFRDLEVLSTRLFYYDCATDKQIEELH